MQKRSGGVRTMGTGVGAALEKPLTKALTKQLRAWAVKASRDPGTPETLYHGVITWTRLHGFVSLEIEGALASMGIASDAVFRPRPYMLKIR